MHKIASSPITKECFAFDNEETLDNICVNDTHAEIFKEDFIPHWHADMVVENIIDICEDLRKMYLETNNKVYWRLLIQILPNAWMQKRTITLSYQTLRSMYFARNGHKLTEWHEFCAWIEKLPYAEELICFDTNRKLNFEKLKKYMDAFSQYAKEKDYLKFVDYIKEKFKNLFK